MKHEKFVWITLIQLMCLKECWFSNSTQTIFTKKGEAVTINNVRTTPPPLLNSSDVTVRVKNESTHLELLEIFHGMSNDTKNNPKVTENILKVNEDNDTKADHPFTELSWNDTIKTNYTLTSESIASEGDSSFWLQSTGTIAAGVFLISAVVGYFSCVGYRRFMQKKYGNSQIVAGEDVYDTSDLRYFEI